MEFDSVERAEGGLEMGMTDLQFQGYRELQNKYDAMREERDALFRQLEGNSAIHGEMGMTDLQFMAYKEIRDQREEELLQKICRLRGGSNGQNDEGMTDFQFKQIIEMVYQIVKANHEAGKSIEEILAIISALRDSKG